MIGVLIVTHGSIGESLLSSASQILGGLPPLVATLGVSRNDDPDDIRLRAGELVEGLDQGDGVLVLTDIFGATPRAPAARLPRDSPAFGMRARQCGTSLPSMISTRLSPSLISGM